MTANPPSGASNPFDATDDSPKEQRLKRAAWHRKASKPVSVWIGILILFSFIHWMFPNYRWLLIHMFTLGVVTNSIMLWSQHFTEKFLHNHIEDSERAWQLRRFWILNAGIVTTITGQFLETWWARHWIVTCVGATLVGCSLAYHAFYLGRQYLGAKKGQRFAPSVLAYVASAACLPFGALMGGFMSVPMGSPWQERLKLAHVAVNVLGFVGFAAVGSLALLFATVWRAQSGKDRMAHVVAFMGVGVLTAATGALLGFGVVVGIGLAFYLAGVLIASASWAHTVRLVAQDPRDRITFAAMSVAAAAVWLFGALAVFTYRAFTAPDVTAITLPTMALLIGFAAQLLAGVMSYLLPSNIGGGPAATRTGMIVMDRAGLFRFALVNLGLAIWLYTQDSWLRVVSSLLSMGSLAMVFFLIPFSAKAQLGVIRKQREALELPAKPKWGQLTAACAVVALVLAASGGLGTTGTKSATTTSNVAATGQTTEASVEMQDMRFSPDTITVPTGNALTVNVTNTDTMVHDLTFANGATSGRLQPGESATVEVGVIGQDLEGWCSIAGHRQQGMVIHVTAEGASSGSASDMSTMSGSPGSSTSETVTAADKLNQDNFVDPRLQPASSETVHKVTLDISEIDVPIADGVSRGRWTFNGGVQGPTLRGKVGDTFEVTLVNNGSIPHSIDFHAGMVSPDSVMRSINPGESLQYTFRAEHAGAWLYHCGTMPVSMHIAAGMFGAVIIDPPNLAKVDHEYLIVQSEVYGLSSTKDNPVDSTLLQAGTPSATVFNGIENQYVAKPIEMNAGETARFWLVNAGPNLSESFHIIGTQFHTTYKEGAYLLKDAEDQGGSQALDLLAAQGGFVEAAFPEAGTYTMVNHQFIDAERGAKGKIVVK